MMPRQVLVRETPKMAAEVALFSCPLTITSVNGVFKQTAIKRDIAL